jgi:ribosome-associated protein
MAKRIKKESSSEQLLNTIVEGILEVKGKHPVILDLRKVDNASADYFVVCHGTSTTQVSAIARSVEKETEEKLNESPWHIEGSRNAQWILMDYVNVVVHVFDETSRAYYDIEDLWADAQITEIAETQA